MVDHFLSECLRSGPRWGSRFVRPRKVHEGRGTTNGSDGTETGLVREEGPREREEERGKEGRSEDRWEKEESL